MVDRSAIEAMPFTSQPLFVDTRTWVQQQAYRGSVENLHLPLTVKEPTPQSRTGIEGTKPVSMADRARLVHLPLPEHGLRCPRCDSSSTKFCYFNNYNLSQPRHFCKTCRRYWTRGGSLRNVPVGGGCRKTKKTKRTSTSVIASSSRSADTLTHPRHLVPEVIASQLPPTVYQPIEQFGLAADIGLNVGGNMLPMFSPLEFSGETENGGANHWRLPEFHMHQLSSYMNAFEQRVMFANGGGGSEVQNAMIPPFSDVILGRVQEEEVEGEATKTEGSSTGSGSKLIELQGLGSPFWSYV